MITRAEWGARRPKGTAAPTARTGGIVVHYTAVKSPTTHWPDCWNRWRAHQNYHMDTRGWLDIAYNQLVCAHGFHFEGRGWNVRNGANTPENPTTASICWEGGPTDTPNAAVVATINRLIGEGVEAGWAPRVRGHNQVSTTGTACPGPLRALIADGRIGIITAPPPPPPPPAGTPVMGPAKATEAQAAAFVIGRATGAAYPEATIRQIVAETYRIAAADGVRPDLALALMVKETGFFRYGGGVQPHQWNFGGIGATGGVPGLTFPTITAGVAAVVRRMRMYAVNDPAAYDLSILGRELPSTIWGTAPNIENFNGLWAVPGTGYGESIVALADLMRQTTPPPPPPPPAVPFTSEQVTWLDSRYVRRT